MSPFMRALLAPAAALALSVPAFAAEPLITPAELLALQANPDVVVLDMRLKQPDGSMDYAKGHIPGAIHAPMDVKKWRTVADGVPMMLPEPAAFEAYMRELGIDADDTVVLVYDGHGKTPCDFSNAARAYWSLKSMGHEEISILNGGVKAWTEAGLGLAVSPTLPDGQSDFTARFSDQWLADADDVKAAIASPEILVDARPADFYKGAVKHDAAKAAGTIPTAINLPAGLLLKDGAMKDAAAIRAAFARAGVGPDDALIAFCNAGFHAATAWFAASEVAEFSKARMYDGSMIGWTRDPANPVATSVAMK